MASMNEQITFDDVFYSAVVDPSGMASDATESAPNHGAWQATTGAATAIRDIMGRTSSSSTDNNNETTVAPQTIDKTVASSTTVPELSFHDLIHTSPQPDLQVPSTPSSYGARHEGRRHQLTIDVSATGIDAGRTYTPPASTSGAISPSYLYPQLSPEPLSRAPSPARFTPLSSSPAHASPVGPPTIIHPTPSPQVIHGSTFSALRDPEGGSEASTHTTMHASSQDAPFLSGHCDYDSLSAGPTSPIRPLSAISMATSSSLTSLSSLSSSGSSASLSSYASSYGAPPNTFPYNLMNRPDTPAGPTQVPHRQLPSPVGFLGSPVKSGGNTHLTPHALAHLTLAHNISRSPSPMPSPTSAYAATALINVGNANETLAGAQVDHSVPRPVTPQTPISGTAALSLSDLYNDNLLAGLQPSIGSAKRSREPSECTAPSLTYFASPTRRSNASSPSKRSTVSSSGGSMRGEKEDIWPEDVEQAFMEALRVIPKLGRRKVMINGKPCGRNELIADYIRRKTFKLRSRKQVSSHIQVLKNIRRNDEEFMNLVTENFEEIEGFPAALLQAGFHAAQIPCLKEDLSSPVFGQAYPPLIGLAASPMGPHAAFSPGARPTPLTTAPYGVELSLSQGAVARAPLQYHEASDFGSPAVSSARVTRSASAITSAASSIAMERERGSIAGHASDLGRTLGPALYDQEATTSST